MTEEYKPIQWMPLTSYNEHNEIGYELADVLSQYDINIDNDRSHKILKQKQILLYVMMPWSIVILSWI